MEIDKEAIDKRLTPYQQSEDTVGENGSLKQLTKALVERAMEAERGTTVTFAVSASLERGVPRCGSIRKWNLCSAAAMRHD
jgi:hypothetical protein